MLKNLFGSEDEGKLQPGDEELIGTSIFGDDDFENVPDWIQMQIHKIRSNGLGESPEELTHELVGRTFIYRLDFDGPSGEILGVYRKLRGESHPSSKKAATAKKVSTSPQWQFIGMCVPNREITNLSVPKWVRQRIKYLYAQNNGYSRTHQIRGKRYRYRLEFKTYSHANDKLTVYRKPRRWYWKKLNG